MPVEVKTLGEQRVCHIRVDDRDDCDSWGWFLCEWTDNRIKMRQIISVILAEFFLARFDSEYFHACYEEAMNYPISDPQYEDILKWLESLLPDEIADLCNYELKYFETFVIRLNGSISIEKVVRR